MTARRVAILGTASSGKSTLAAALASRYNAVWVPEYLREFVDTRQRVPVSEDQFHIASTQVAREDAALAGAGPQLKYLFCDTTPLMTAIYSRHYFHGVDAQLAALVARHCYDVTLVCAPDIPWVADGLQRESEDVSRVVNRMLFEELAARAIPYLLVSGDAATRLSQVERLLHK